MTIANALSAARALLVLPVILLIAVGRHEQALAIFVIAAATDILDGHIARHYHQTTTLGTFLDPLADKVLIVGTLTALAVAGTAPVWALAVVVAREVVAIEVRAHHPGLEAAWDGKVKTVLQVAAVGALLGASVWPAAAPAAAIGVLLLAAVALTVVSGVMLVLRAA